jgi:hypothetical protein
MDGSLESMLAMAEPVTAAFAAAGRERPELGVTCFFALGRDPRPRLQSVVGRYFGYADAETQAAVTASMTITSAEAVAQAVANAEAAGFDEVLFNPTTTDLAEIDRLEDALSSL